MKECLLMINHLVKGFIIYRMEMSLMESLMNMVLEKEGLFLDQERVMNLNRSMRLKLWNKEYNVMLLLLLNRLINCYLIFLK